MKIEIEFEEVNSLKNEILALKSERNELEKKLNGLDEKELKRQATELGERIFQNVIKRIFKELGFEQQTEIRRLSFEQLELLLGKEWWNHEELDVEIGVNVFRDFRGALLRLGIKTDKKVG